MKELRRLVWRYKRGGYLREKLRDHFIAQTERVAARMRQLRGLLRRSLRGAPNARVARQFDKSIRETVRAARAARFDDALRFLAALNLQLQTVEEIALASNTIDQLQHQIEKLRECLEAWDSVSIDDFWILVLRAQTFYEQENYRRAQIIASEGLNAIAQLTATADKEGIPADLAPRIGRLHKIVDTLEAWGIASCECAALRRCLKTIGTAMAKRQFAFSQLLLEDLEAEHAQVSAFLDLIQLLPKVSQRATVDQLLGSKDNDRPLAWDEVTTRLLSDSLAQAVDALGNSFPTVA